MTTERFQSPVVYQALMASKVGASSFWLDTADEGKVDNLARLYANVQKWAREAAIVRIDNVLDYARDMDGQSYQSSIPVAVPPIESLWLEGDAEALVQRGRNDKPRLERIPVAALVLADRPGVGAAMHVTAMGFCLGVNGNAVAQWTMEYNTGEGGAIAFDGSSRSFNLSGHPGHDPGKAAFPFILALSFMHCDNVKQHRVEPGRTDRRVAARRREPIYSYDVLEIGSIKKALDEEGGVSHQGIAKALHICRGHFATYSEARPLFGKFTGRFWIPMHVRGNVANGVAARDYAITPSTPDPTPPADSSAQSGPPAPPAGS